MNLLADFSNFVGGNPDCSFDHDFLTGTNLASYTGTAVAGGSAAAAPAPNGVVRFSGAATTNASGYQIQTPNTPVQFVSAPGVNAGVAELQGKFSMSSLVGRWMLGFAATGAAILGTPVADGVWLIKTAGTAEVSLVVRRGGVSITQSLGNLASANVQEWTLQVNSKATARQAEIIVYRDGVVVYQADGRSRDLFTNVPDDALLSPSFAFQSGSAAGTQTCDLDYLRGRWSRK